MLAWAFCVCYRETRRLGMHKHGLGQETTKVTHNNANPPTQANNAARAIYGNPPIRPLCWMLAGSGEPNFVTVCYVVWEFRMPDNHVSL